MGVSTGKDNPMTKQKEVKQPSANRVEPSVGDKLDDRTVDKKFLHLLRVFAVVIFVFSFIGFFMSLTSGSLESSIPSAIISSLSIVTFWWCEKNLI